MRKRELAYGNQFKQWLTNIHKKFSWENKFVLGGGKSCISLCFGSEVVPQCKIPKIQMFVWRETFFQQFLIYLCICLLRFSHS